MDSRGDEKAIDRAAARLGEIQQAVSRVVVGQDRLVESLLVAMLCRGHVLLEGVPGLAKTLTVRTLAGVIGGSFQRLQFTPDLLPADVTGTQIFDPRTSTFVPHRGPIFCNLVLADEINRAPAKVQSALLEAMGEHQITVGQRTYPLPQLFMVLATQNPVEQEGTYHLPEAQLDRFLMQARVEYPTREEELQILELDSNQLKSQHKPPVRKLPQSDLFAMRREVAKLYLDPKLNSYIVDLVQATRNPKAYDSDLARWCRIGASPRASIALARCSRARAWIDGDTFVAPNHIQAVAPEILRHRILLTFEALKLNAVHFAELSFVSICLSPNHIDIGHYRIFPFNPGTNEHFDFFIRRPNNINQFKFPLVKPINNGYV